MTTHQSTASDEAQIRQLIAQWGQALARQGPQHPDVVLRARHPDVRHPPPTAISRE